MVEPNQLANSCLKRAIIGAKDHKILYKAQTRGHQVSDSLVVQCTSLLLGVQTKIEMKCYQEIKRSNSGLML